MSAEPVPPSSPPEEGGEEDRYTLAQLLHASRHPGESPSELQMALERLLAARTADPGRRLRLVGRARKVSVSMPEDLTVAVQQRVGRGEFSQYVTEAVARQLELDLLGELAAVLEAEHGPVSAEALVEARRSWPDTE
jgi:hypothetical protein